MRPSLPVDEPVELLRHEFRSGQIGVGESDHEKLVGIRDLDSIRIGNSLQEIVVVGDPQGVECCVSPFYVRAESNAFDLGRNFAGGETVVGEQLHDIHSSYDRMRMPVIRLN